MCLQEFQISSTVRGYSVRNLNILPIFQTVSSQTASLCTKRLHHSLAIRRTKMDVYLMLWRKIRLQVVVEDFLTKQNPIIYVK
jgi:hypothetical protein